MGKLAERLSDPARSGVYRIETTEAVEEAAASNRYPLLRIALNGSAVLALDAAVGAESRVVVVSGFERLARERPEAIESLLVRLGLAARAWRDSGARVFVTFLDPQRVLASLPPLYNWNKKRP